MCIAFVCSIGFTVASYVSVGWGVGLPLSAVPMDWQSKCIQVCVANMRDAPILTQIVVAIRHRDMVLPGSVLHQAFCHIPLSQNKYARVPRRSTRVLTAGKGRELRNELYYGSIAMISLLFVHLATTLIVVLLQCIPIQRYWRPEVEGRCVSITAFLYCKRRRLSVQAATDVTHSRKRLHNHHRPSDVGPPVDHTMEGATSTCREGWPGVRLSRRRDLDIGKLRTIILYTNLHRVQ